MKLLKSLCRASLEIMTYSFEVGFHATVFIITAIATNIQSIHIILKSLLKF